MNRETSASPSELKYQSNSPICSSEDIQNGRIPELWQPRLDTIRAKGEKGLVFITGGGAAKGFQATCGAMSALEFLGLRSGKADIHIGTSAGAIILALMELVKCNDPHELYNMFQQTIVPMNGLSPWNDLASIATQPSGIWKMELGKFANKFLKNYKKPESRPPLRLISHTRLQPGKRASQVYYSDDQWTHKDGSIDKEQLLGYVNRSSSIPVLHQLGWHNGAFITDGGTVNNLDGNYMREIETSLALAPEAFVVAFLPIPPRNIRESGVHLVTLSQGTTACIVVPKNEIRGRKFRDLVYFDGEKNFQEGWEVIQKEGYKVIDELQNRKII